MLQQLVKSVLVLLFGYLLRLGLLAIGVELDEATFNAIVAGLATYFLGLFGFEGVRKAAPTLF